jgi:hypothetical protein
VGASPSPRRLEISWQKPFQKPFWVSPRIDVSCAASVHSAVSVNSTNCDRGGVLSYSPFTSLYCTEVLLAWIWLK